MDSAKIEPRPLGMSGLQVSALGFGAMTFGGGGRYSRIGDTDRPGAQRIIGRCLDAGVNLFDTANSYSDGASEEILGKAIGARRDEAIIATKAYNRIGPGPNDLGASRSYLIRSCEESLRRLGTDYIDLFQLHNFDSLTPLEETLRTLDDLVRAGKVRYIGISNYSGWQLMKALATLERLGLDRIVSQQIRYSLLFRDSENELIPLSLDQGVGVIVHGPLAGGLLSGKFRRDQPQPEGARTAGTVDDATLRRVHDLTDALADIAATHGATPSQVALNYVMHRPAVTSVLIGARDEAQLEQNLGAARLSLSDEERQRLDDVSETPWIYPYSMLAGFAGDRNPYFLRGRPWAHPMGK